MSGSEGGDRQDESDQTPQPRRTHGKGDSTDSQGGRGDSDDDQDDEFAESASSQAALDAEHTIQEIEQRQAESESGSEGYTVEDYSPDDVDEWRSLGDIEANHGNSMQAKEVGVIDGDGDDETRVVHTDLDHFSIDEEDGERQMVGYEWMNEINPEMTVEHNANFEDGWYANEVAPGVDAKDAKDAGFADAVDQETFNEMAATQVIIGNTDAHSNNVRVDEEGNLHPFDLDRAAGDIDSDWVGALTQYENTQDRILGELETTATALDVEMDREAVLDQAQSMAADLEDMDPPDNADAWNSDLSATIEQNIQSLAEDASPASQSDSGYNPDEVPSKREGTQYENFTSKQITDAAAYAMQNGKGSSRRWATWQQFYDSMTDAELEEAAVKTVTTTIEKEDTLDNNPENYYPNEFSQNDQAPSIKSRKQDTLAGALTRVHSDSPAEQRETFERLQDEAPADKEDMVAQVGSAWFSSAEVRREIYEENQSAVEQESSYRKAAELQFGESHTDRAETLITQYTGSTGKTTSKVTRACLAEYGINKETDIAHFNKGTPARGVEPTPEFASTVRQLQKETGQYIDEEHDGEVTLWRETKNEITSNASAESWTSVEGGTGDFGEHTMQARFRPGQVIATQQLDKHENLGYGGAFAKEEEWTVLGGYLARNIPEESKATDYYDEDKDQTPRAD